MSFSGDPALLHRRISEATTEAIRKSEIYLPDDVKERLTAAAAKESGRVARQELANILENIRFAEERNTPLCQDTGIIVLYVTIPADMSWTEEMEQAVYRGVRDATVSVPLRPNLVDPITRENTG
ncbi:MAG: fumarate hydratase, partial [Methanospirillum sp.]|nr:fumarate hydratase [Methanospirillum sp.]